MSREKPAFTVDTDYLLWCISMNDDKKAYRALFEYYYPALCLYAKRYIENKETREDIVQDVFFSIWEKRKSIVVETSAKSYLISSVKNMSLNYLRKQGYQQEYRHKEAVKSPVYATHPDEIYDLQELQDLLEKTLTKLPEEYRIAFVMSRFEDKSTTEIAEVLGVSVRTVERYRNKAIELLAEELKDFLPLSLVLFFLNS